VILSSCAVEASLNNEVGTRLGCDKTRLLSRGSSFDGNGKRELVREVGSVTYIKCGVSRHDLRLQKDWRCGVLVASEHDDLGIDNEVES
jgi:hypothetical protein